MEFSNRISSIQASTIREILKQTSNSNIISFAGGNPSTEAFPIKEIQKISNEILTEDPIGILQYGISEGDPMFLKEIEKFFNRKEYIVKDNDGILITSGSQQIMEFCVKSLCNDDDLVLCEDPTFIGAINAFKSQGARLKGIRYIDGKLDLEALERAYKLKPKFIYLIPNFQNPTGNTMDLETRKKVLELSYKYNVTILEDDPYGCLRFNGESIPSIKSLDTKGIVIYAGSLSKIIAPGLRVAACIADKKIIDRFTICKQVSDIHSSLWSQKVICKYLQEYNIEEHLIKIKEIYKNKCQLMIDNINKYFNPNIKYIEPTGGMFIWITLPEYVDISLFVKTALENKVAIVPGDAFSVEGEETHSIRLNFSTSSNEQIIEGIKILGKITYQMI